MGNVDFCYEVVIIITAIKMNALLKILFFLKYLPMIFQTIISASWHLFKIYLANENWINNNTLKIPEAIFKLYIFIEENSYSPSGWQHHLQAYILTDANENDCVFLSSH